MVQTFFLSTFNEDPPCPSLLLKLCLNSGTPEIIKTPEIAKFGPIILKTVGFFFTFLATKPCQKGQISGFIHKLMYYDVNCKVTQNGDVFCLMLLFIIAFVFARASITHACTSARTLLIQYDITPETGLVRLAALS